jgi:hypothetical protein
MTDIAKCAAESCGLSSECLRKLASEHPAQSWMLPRQTGNSCQLFIPIQHATAMSAPTDQELQSFYSEWFEENYCTKPAKPAPAVLAFAKAVLQRYASSSIEGGE